MSRARTVWSTGWHNTGTLTERLNVGRIDGTQFVWWFDGGELCRLGALRRAGK